MKVITEDFQSLKGINTFEFIPGINMIIGSNGSGKSSLFYAIENCLENPNGVDDCINFDSDSTRVTIENNDESITWIREKGSSTYVNNKTGDVKFKASKLTSYDLADLGFYTDKKGRIMNIHNEWSTLFPFGESDNDMFRLFEDIFNISCSFDILDNIKKDEQEVKSNLKQLTANREVLQDKLNKLNEIAAELNTIDIENIIIELKEVTDAQKALAQDYKTYSDSLFFSTIVLPKAFDISSIYDVYYKADQLERDNNLYQQNLQKINIEFQPIQITLDFEEPKQLIEDFKSYCSLLHSINEYNNENIKLSNELEVVKEKISQIKVCPTCGHKLGE